MHLPEHPKQGRESQGRHSRPRAPKRAAPADAKLRIAIVDDHPLMRQGLSSTLRAQPDFEVVGEGGTGEDAIRIAETALPDLIILDVNMPGNGISGARAINHRCPAVKIMVLTAYDDEQTVSAALQAGASGYLLKGTSENELIEITRAIAAGEVYISPGLAAKLVSIDESHAGGAVPKLDFSDREHQVLEGIAQGRSTKEIGRSLGIAETPVKKYLANILRKVHVRSRLESALAAQDRSLSLD